MNKPLEGLFVVELTTYWAAPSAGEFLRCLGARVVKIETGKAGDSVRYWGRTCGMPIEANENPSFDLFNGGKEFMHMDLNDPEHERVLHQHARQGGRIPDEHASRRSEKAQPGL